MGDKTKIEWTDAAWNPLRGCSRISDGCRNCYAETVAHRFSGPGMPYEGLTRIVNGRPTWTGEIRLVPELLDQPLRWTRPRRIFVNSMSDLFHDGVPDDFLPYVFSVMAVAKRHVFQILTKRPERMRKVMNDYAFFDTVSCFAKQGHGVEITADDWPLPNVWLGVSVENQATADERIPLLLDTPAAVRWVSAEPLLSEIDVSRWLDPAGIECMDVCPSDRFVNQAEAECVVANGDIRPLCPYCGQAATWTGHDGGIDWVVAGGESGSHARPSHPDWLRAMRDQCKAAGVPFLFKQWGEWIPGSQSCDIGNQTALIGACQRGHRWDSGAHSWCIGKKAAGRLLDGVLHDEYPEPASLS